MQDIEEFSKILIDKLHRKFKYTSCTKTAKGYFDSARIIKKEAEMFVKKKSK